MPTWQHTQRRQKAVANLEPWDASEPLYVKYLTERVGAVTFRNLGDQIEQVTRFKACRTASEFGQGEVQHDTFTEPGC